MAKERQEDRLLLAKVRSELFSAVLGDVMDAMGLIRQYLPPQIRPLQPDMVVIGRAMPVLEADCSGTYVASQGSSEPFGKMFQALDSLGENDVYVCTGSSPTYALWGELMSTRAGKLGAVGAVVNGFSRDTRGVLDLGFPVFSWGSYGQDQGVRGRVIDYGCPIEFPNGVVVEPGDIVFGDIDGVVAIPKRVEQEVIEAALEKVRGENNVRKELESGESATSVFKKYGIM